MGKKRQRAKQVSKGITHQNPNRFGAKISKAMRIDYLQSDQRLANQVKAWRAHKNVMLTILNPDKNNTKERMIRVPAIEVWGYPRDMQIKMR
jgi:hypothetical protein